MSARETAPTAEDLEYYRDRNPGHLFGLAGNFEEAFAAEFLKHSLASKKKKQEEREAAAASDDRPSNHENDDTPYETIEHIETGGDDREESNDGPDTPEKVLTGHLALSNDISSGHDQEFLHILNQKLDCEASAQAETFRDSESEAPQAPNSRGPMDILSSFPDFVYEESGRNWDRSTRRDGDRKRGKSNEIVIQDPKLWKDAAYPIDEENSNLRTPPFRDFS